MELDDGGGGCDSFGRDYVLACVVALLRTGPEEETIEQSCDPSV